MLLGIASDIGAKLALLYPGNYLLPLMFLPLRVSQALAPLAGEGLAAGLIRRQRCWHNRDGG